jgi:hypothetical protein
MFELLIVGFIVGVILIDAVLLRWLIEILE